MLQRILLRISLDAKSAAVVTTLVAIFMPLGLIGASAGEKQFKRLKTKEILSHIVENEIPRWCPLVRLLSERWLGGEHEHGPQDHWQMEKSEQRTLYFQEGAGRYVVLSSLGFQR